MGPENCTMDGLPLQCCTTSPHRVPGQSLSPMGAACNMDPAPCLSCGMRLVSPMRGLDASSDLLRDADNIAKSPSPDGILLADIAEAGDPSLHVAAPIPTAEPQIRT